MSERATMNKKPVFEVPAASIINFDSGFKPKLLCDGPTFTTGLACAYSCSYCSVSTTLWALHQPKGYLAQHGVPAGQHKHREMVVRRKDPVAIAEKQLLSKSLEYRNQRNFVIYASPLVDVAANMELARETVEVVALILQHTNWDIRLLSKSNSLPKIANDLQALGWEKKRHKERVIYGVSTGTLDDKLGLAFEKDCPLVRKRIESLHWLQDNGYRTFGMICPSLPQRDYAKFANEIADAIRAEKCEHVWAEVINVRGENFTETEKCLRAAGYDVDADALKLVSHDRASWERYARDTFEAHAAVPRNRGKLRFLQYITADNREYWKSKESVGAVCLEHVIKAKKKKTKPEEQKSLL